MRTRAAMALAVGLLAAGCGGEDPPPHPAAAARPAADASPWGSYVRAVTRADIARTRARRRESAGQGAPEPGRVALTLTRGTLRVHDHRAGLTIRQDVSATADGVLRLGAYQRPELGSFCGPDVAATAAYRWRRAGDALLLRATDDACADRDSVLSGRWRLR